jgi:cytochrome P450
MFMRHALLDANLPDGDNGSLTHHTRLPCSKRPQGWASGSYTGDVTATADVALDIRRGSGELPAGPALLPRVLNGQAFRQSTAHFMLDNARRYGDLVHYRALGRNVYQISHPALISRYFLEDSQYHHRNLVMQAARQVLGHGLLTSEEPLHMRQRRLAQPAFLRDRIAAYAEIIAAKTVGMTAEWQTGTVTDLHPQMLELALRIVGKCLFDLDTLDDVAAIATAVDAFMSFMPLSFLPFSKQIQQLPIPSMKRLRDGKTFLDTMIYRMIDERRKDPTDRGDLLSMLLHATDPEDASAASNTMTDQQLHDECVTVILAGHETTANALSFALHLLAHHPEVQQRLHDEAAAVLGSRTPTSADYARLGYATQVFAETLRLYPPVWTTARTCAVEYEIAGYKIPLGASILAPQYAVHRDPRFWDKPEVFDPERFTPGAKAGRPRYAYFPFAGGSRQCIAEGLAWMEGTFVLAVVARDWKLTPPPGSPAVPALNPAVSLRPKHGIRLRIDRR